MFAMGCNILNLRKLRKLIGFSLGSNLVFGLNAFIYLNLPWGKSLGFICDSSRWISFIPNIGLEKRSFAYESKQNKKKFIYL